jgi:hypothetical protein
MVVVVESSTGTALVVTGALVVVSEEEVDTTPELETQATSTTRGRARAKCARGVIAL